MLLGAGGACTLSKTVIILCAHFRGAFIVARLRHTRVIIMHFKQCLDLPHL